MSVISDLRLPSDRAAAAWLLDALVDEENDHRHSVMAIVRGAASSATTNRVLDAPVARLLTNTRPANDDPSGARRTPMGVQRIVAPRRSLR